MTCKSCGKEIEKVKDLAFELFFGEDAKAPERTECFECEQKRIDERNSYLASLPLMKPITHTTIDCDDFEAICQRQNAKILVKTDFESPVGTSQLTKYEYINNNGQTRYCLEYGLQYAADAFAVEIWLFDNDFNEDQVGIFLRNNYWTKNS
jgi:hypothetical protein